MHAIITSNLLTVMSLNQFNFKFIVKKYIHAKNVTFILTADRIKYSSIAAVYMYWQL